MLSPPSCVEGKRPYQTRRWLPQPMVRTRQASCCGQYSFARPSARSEFTSEEVHLLRVAAERLAAVFGKLRVQADRGAVVRSIDVPDSLQVQVQSLALRQGPSGLEARRRFSSFTRRNKQWVRSLRVRRWAVQVLTAFCLDAACHSLLVPRTRAARPGTQHASNATPGQ